MEKPSAQDLFAAAEGRQTSRELTPKELESVATFKTIRDTCRKLSFQPPCECNICLRQYRTKDDQNIIPWRYFGHTHDPSCVAQSYAQAIRKDREFLYHKILTSGPALLKRWRNGESRRKEYLIKAEHYIYPCSQPLIDIASRFKMLQEARKHKPAYLLPYINTEDLSKDSANFIRLLHHRTTFPPQDWVHFDNAQLQPGWKQGGPGEKSAEGSIIVHGEKYGTWIQFDRQAVHRGDAYGAIRGLVILEAQQILMSFLRKMVTTILGDGSASDPPIHQVEKSLGSLTLVPYPHYDLTSCNKWMRFIGAEPHRDQHWLSVASIYTQQPFSAPTYFDIDVIIEIAETKTMEAADELWLLQTDLDYFHDLMKRHEREWLDSVPRMEEVKVFSPKDKMDNIGYIMTVKALIQVRDWQWLLEECMTVKRIMGEPESKTHVEQPLSVWHEMALCGLQYLLQEAQSWYRVSLLKLFKSQAFQSITEVTAVGKDQRDSWVLGFNFKDYPQLYRKDRIGWCLYNLTKDPKDIFTFERSVVLQHLEKYLETCPRREFERIDQEMYKCISDMAAVERMLSILELHRPNFAYLAQNPFRQPRQAWQVRSRLSIKPSDMTCAQMNLGSTLESSAKFPMPMGKRDEQWLAQRDRAQQNLNDLWKKARLTYQSMLQASEVPQKFIEPQLAMMRQGDSSEHKAQLDLERRQILERLRAARQEALAKSTIPPKVTTGNFTAQYDLPPHRIEEPGKEKNKTRPEGTSASPSLHKKYAVAFANLAVDEEIKEAAKRPPVLYTLKQNSVAYQVIPLMFPDRSMGIEEGGKTVDWLDFVATMDTLGFTAEHRGGSAFTFKGAVRLPSNPSTLQKKSIGVHMPHPSTEMGPILLQSLGRRCNRRFGWRRANFAVDEGDVGQGV